MNLTGFVTYHYTNMDEETKAKILNLHDHVEDFKALDRKTMRQMIRN